MTARCRASGSRPRPGLAPLGRAALPAATGALALLLLGAAGAARADSDDDAGWRIALRSAHHSDALALRAMDQGDARRLAPRPGRNLAYIDDELRLSRSQGHWQWSLLARSSATLVASADTLTLAARLASAGLPQADHRWQTDVRLRGFTGAGIELGRSHQPWASAAAALPASTSADADAGAAAQAAAAGPARWSLRWSAQVLSLARWRDRRITGPVAFDAASASYAFDLQSTETDQRLRFPFQQPAAARGTALLLAGELAWLGGPWSASVALRDLGQLRWPGIAQQQATLATATQAVDADGLVVYRPLINGSSRQDGLSAAAPWRLKLLLGRQMAAGLLPAGQLALVIDALPGFGALPGLQWQQGLGPVTLGAGWLLHERRASLSLAWQRWQLRLGADRLAADAHSRELALAGTWPF